MSRPSHSRSNPRPRAPAHVFAALGDQTRLLLVRKLCGGEPRSISQLTRGSRLTRQAITKHLRVLENAKIVRCVRSGRESLFEFNPQSMEELKQYLEFVSVEWDQALARLKSFVET
ncbi:Regulatory protein ArsR [Acidobacteriia bacterium SbA2]|nr:Regulatory protein ArsR [Acidobacteriia bacterium SbA2]